MSNVTLHPGDNRLSLRRLIDQGVRVHSVVTDPPYGLVSITKRFGKEGAAPAKFGTDGAFARASKGFMGSTWDGTGIERDPEFWRLLWEILLPGGYVFAFSGSRTGHWQACAMEMAGFIMHPMHGWVFGSGFPKAHAADKAIDKHFGAERADLGQSPNWRESKRNREINGSMEVRGENAGRITAPATEEAAEWEGWAYGTQAQKPALENLYLGQKPFAEVEIFQVLVRDSLLKQMDHQTCQSEVRGAELIKSANIVEVLTTLRNLDLVEADIAQSLVRLLQEPATAQRTGAVGDILGWTDMLSSELALNTSSNTAKSWLTSLVALWSLGNTFTTAITSDMITDLKIWNLLAGQIIRESTTRQNEPIGEMSNVSIAGQCLKRACASLLSRISTIATEIVIAQLAPTDGDRAVGSNAHVQPIYLGQKPFDCKTGAANLLKHGVGAVNIDGCRVPAEKTVGWGGARGGSDDDTQSQGRNYRLAAGDARPVEGRHPANLILDGSPEVVAMFPAKAGAAAPVKGTEKSATGDENTNCYGKYGRIASVHHGDSGSAARFFHQFGPDTDPLFYHPKAGKADRAGSRHPTVKPIALMQYLIRHITPPGGVVLDPFAGSGTTAEAARREGFDCILMEAEPEYLDFLEGRFALRDMSCERKTAYDDDHILLDEIGLSEEDILLDTATTTTDDEILI